MHTILRTLKRFTPRPLLLPYRKIRSFLYRFCDLFLPVITSRKYLGFQLWYSRGDGLIDRLRFGSPQAEYEPHICDAIEEAIKKVSRTKNKTVVFFDIGANIGLISLSILNRTSAQVHAFEPGRKQFAVLQATIIANNLFDRLQAHSIAFSNKTEITKFWSDATPGGGSGDGMRQTSRVKKAVAYDVDTETLDSWCDRHNTYPDILKIDTEGAEKYILDGGSGVLSRKPILFIEINPLNLSVYPYNELDVIDTLHKYNYAVTTISGINVTKDNISKLVVEDDMFIATQEK